MADVGELAMAMSGDFGAVGAEVGKTQADYEAAAKRAREFQSVQEQLANTMQSLIPVVKPLIKFIGEFTLAFSEFVLEYKDEIQAMFKGCLFYYSEHTHNSNSSSHYCSERRNCISIRFVGRFGCWTHWRKKSNVCRS